MSKKSTRLYTILGSAVGTAVAVFGVRRAVQWWNDRQEQGMLPAPTMSSRAHYFDTSAPQAQAPGQPPAQTMQRQPAQPPAQSPAQSPSGNQPFSGTQPVREGQSQYGSRGPMENQAVTQPVSQQDYRPVDQPDHVTIPTTGPSPAMPTTAQSSPDMTDKSIRMDDLAGPLIQYAIAFNSVMTLLRSKQRDSDISDAGQAFTPGDRSSMQSVLDQLREQQTEMDDAGIGRDPLRQRTYRLTRKLRDTMESLDFSEADLFRINGELSSELCSLTRELQQSGQVSITGLDQVRQLFECK